MDKTLPAFIEFLERHDLVAFDIDGESEDQFNNRLKIQKYVFLSKKFGMPFTYPFNMYMYGPYSPSLTTDYYELAKDNDAKISNSMALPVEFRQDEFLTSLKNDPQWLEIATTLIDRNHVIHSRDTLVNRVYHIKSHFNLQFIHSVLDDLVKHNLVKTS